VGTQVPFAGEYKVEIRISPGPNCISRIVDVDQIEVHFYPVQKAPNYNPLYELPINGLLGLEGEVFSRENYGVKFDDEFNISENLTFSNDFSENQSLKEIKIQNFDDLNIVNEGIVLQISKDKVVFSPSYPVPIFVKINESENNDIFYEIKSGDLTYGLKKEWFVEGESKTFWSKIIEDNEYYMNIPVSVSFKLTKYENKKATIVWPVKKKYCEKTMIKPSVSAMEFPASIRHVN
jgi:hypothetical protein